MELHYVEVENWDKLWDKDHIIFKLPKKQIEYEISIFDGVICCVINADTNSEIFDYLNLDATDFVQNIVKYPCTGVWPKVKSLDDLKKVIKALDYECVKKFGKPNTPKFKVGDKVRILPRKGDPEDYDWGLLRNITKVNYATEEEKRLLDSKFLEEGYRWISSTKKLEAIDSSTSINMDKPETQFEAEVNLFPTKKHYQLNFNY